MPTDPVIPGGPGDNRWSHLGVDIALLPPAFGGHPLIHPRQRPDNHPPQHPGEQGLTPTSHSLHSSSAKILIIIRFSILDIDVAVIQRSSIKMDNEENQTILWAFVKRDSKPCTFVFVNTNFVYLRYVLFMYVEYKYFGHNKKCHYCQNYIKSGWQLDHR